MIVANLRAEREQILCGRVAAGGIGNARFDSRTQGTGMGGILGRYIHFFRCWKAGCVGVVTWWGSCRTGRVEQRRK